MDTFWKRVNRTDGCWLWTGGKNSQGYGQVKINGRITPAHHIAVRLQGLEIDGILLHSCDTPACVNPRHLSLGTNADNSSDMVAKGRSLRGERNHKAKLSATDVRSIRAWHSQGNVTKKTIAKEYGVSDTLISFIISRKIWRD